MLVNNAAANFPVAAADLSPNGWRAVERIVLDGTFFCSQELHRRVTSRGGHGAIVNIATTAAMSGGPGMAHSAAAKAGVVSLTKTLAVEWAPDGVRVNAIAPGPIDTQGAAAQLWADPAIRDALIGKVPLRRFGTEQEIADAAAYLVSEYAGYVTGEVLVADGGAWLEKGMFGLGRE